MVTDLCILIRRPPYGSICAAEGVRHLIGAMANGLSVNVILMDDGVWVARVGQNAGASGWTALSEALANTSRLADRPAPQVLADEDALTSAGLTVKDLVPGVIVASPEAVAELVATARYVLIF